MTRIEKILMALLLLAIAAVLVFLGPMRRSVGGERNETTVDDQFRNEKKDKDKKKDKKEDKDKKDQDRSQAADYADGMASTA